jgi:hypothetical protein
MIQLRRSRGDERGAAHWVTPGVRDSGSDDASAATAAELEGYTPMLERMLITLLMVLGYPFYLLLRLIEEVSGEGRWYRQQRRLMEEDRPLLSDAELLHLVPVQPGDEPLWLAVRRAVAESTGLPPEALHPLDKLADLWRMQWIGPDIMDLVFRLERILAVKIPRSAIERSAREMCYGQVGVFWQFADGLVRDLRDVIRVNESTNAQAASE